MGQTILVVLGITEIVVGFFVLAIATGRWAGNLEARRGGRNPMSTSPSDATGANGQPTHMELVRRVTKLEDDRRVYVRRRELEDTLRIRDDSQRRDRDELLAAVKRLEQVDGAITRRVDEFIGQGS